MNSGMRKGLTKNKKIKLILVCLLIVFTCAGYIFYVPKLINADKPFIDLSGSVGDAIGNAESVSVSGNRDSDKVPKPTAAVTPTPIPRDRTDSKESVTIRVSDMTITVNGIRVDSFEDFAVRITGQAFAGKSFELIDDYAELKTFRKAIRILDEYDRSYYVRTEE